MDEFILESDLMPRTLTPKPPDPDDINRIVEHVVPNVLNQRIIFAGLVLAVHLCVIGSVVLELRGITTPPALIGLASVSLGALCNALSPVRK